MEHFRVFSIKAQLLCLICFISQAPIKGNTVKGTLPDVATMLQMVQAFISPYVNSKRNYDGIHLRTLKEGSVEKVIKKKIKELKPFLQDNDEKEKPTKDEEETNNITLEGKDETTIIEFVTNEKFKHKNNLRNKDNTIREASVLREKINKYKQTRRKIRAALKNERVSKKTEFFVINTLDEMMSKIIENPCTWRTTLNNKSNIHKSQKRVDETVSTVTNWSEGFDKLKKYILQSGKNSTGSFPGVKIYLMIEKIYEFLTQVSKDIEELKGYKIDCKFSRPHTMRKKNDENLVLRKGKETKTIKQKNKCEHFKICSVELSKFMTDLYIMLNDTAVSTLRNYAFMYIRDVNTEDSQEKGSVVAVINNISDTAEYKIAKIFKKHTVNFELDANKDENANIKALKNYIKDTIESAKTYIKEKLQISLYSAQSSLLPTVKKDLTVNLDVDLDNLQRDLKSRICLIFSVCNSKPIGRRRGLYDEDYNLGKNSVYVKVQVSLDDEMKNSLARKKGVYYKYKKSETDSRRPMKKHEYNEKSETYRKFKGDIKDLDKNTELKVTRTTLVSPNTTEITTIGVNGTVNVTTTTVAIKVVIPENITDTIILN